MGWNWHGGSSLEKAREKRQGVGLVPLPISIIGMAAGQEKEIQELVWERTSRPAHWANQRESNPGSSLKEPECSALWSGHSEPWMAGLAAHHAQPAEGRLYWPLIDKEPEAGRSARKCTEGKDKQWKFCQEMGPFLKNVSGAICSSWRMLRSAESKEDLPGLVRWLCG